MLREAEHRSTAPIQYWNLPGAKVLIPRQRKCQVGGRECVEGAGGWLGGWGARNNYAGLKMGIVDRWSRLSPAFF